MTKSTLLSPGLWGRHLFFPLQDEGYMPPPPAPATNVLCFSGFLKKRSKWTWAASVRSNSLILKAVFVLTYDTTLRKEWSHNGRISDIFLFLVKNWWDNLRQKSLSSLPESHVREAPPTPCPFPVEQAVPCCCSSLSPGYSSCTTSKPWYPQVRECESIKTGVKNK